VSTKKTILIPSYQTIVHTNGCKVKLAASAAVLTLNGGTQKSVCVPLSLSFSGGLARKSSYSLSLSFTHTFSFGTLYYRKNLLGGSDRLNSALHVYNRGILIKLSMVKAKLFYN